MPGANGLDPFSPASGGVEPVMHQLSKKKQCRVLTVTRGVLYGFDSSHLVCEVRRQEDDHLRSVTVEGASP